MGQKVHPNGIRLGITKPWISTWYADKDYADFLHSDWKIRQFLSEKFLPFHASVRPAIDHG